MSKVLNTVFMIVGYMKGTDELSYWSDELSYLSIDNHSGDPYWSWFGGKEFKTLAEAARVLKQECNADSYMHKAVSKIELIKVQTISEVISTEQVIAAEPAHPTAPVVEPAQEVQAGRMSLGRINHLLAPLELSHQTLADLGFYPTYPPGATLASHPNYAASDFPKICQTISDLAAALTPAGIAAAAWDLAAAAAWESQETAEREAYEAAQRKEGAKREEWRAEMRRDVYGEPN